ncbi:MAG: hypothetical protein ACW98Y_05735 [Candidatus Thorarchaeota archaeon]|jgi:hypothetical protein
MRKLGAIFIILWLFLPFVTGIGSVTHTQQGEYTLSTLDNQGPTIDWYGPDNSTEEAIIAWDGIYNGQTEENWPQRAWVNDTDGVDTVVFMMRDHGETEWLNFTPTLVEGNDTLGRYQYNYTYPVWWNYTRNYPETGGFGGSFEIKIFANDTLGNWSETGILGYTGGYMEIVPPSDVVLMSTLLPILAGVGVIIVAIAIYLVFRRRVKL